MTKYEERYKLTKQVIENGQVTESLEMEFSASYLGEMLKHYDKFLKASGFIYHGTVEIDYENEIL